MLINTKAESHPVWEVSQGGHGWEKRDKPVNKDLKRVVITDLDNTLFDWVDLWHACFTAIKPPLAVRIRSFRIIASSLFQLVAAFLTLGQID